MRHGLVVRRMRCHGAPWHPSHHRDHRRRARQRRVLRRRARPADGQEDRQPGRPDRLSPLLRRRAGSPGADLTFFEYPGARRGPRGRRDGPPDRMARRLGRGAGLLGASGCAGRGLDAVPHGRRAAVRRPRGPRARAGRLRRARRRRCRPPRPTFPAEHALQGFDGVRAYTLDPAAQRASCCATRSASGPGRRHAGRSAASSAAALYRYDHAPPSSRLPGAGTVHHVAFASRREEQEAWQEHVDARGRAADAGDRPLLLPSIYFREPSGVLFELATIGPGLRRRRGRRSTSASSCRCRRDSSSCASSSSGR